MSVFEAIFLGILQGVTEFLPISSSGHLAIGTTLLGMEDPSSNLALVVLLHFASLMAIITVFFKDIIQILSLKRINTLTWIIVGTIPAVIVGLYLKDHISFLFTPKYLYLVGIALLINGIILLVAEATSWGMRTPLENTGFKNSFIIGIAQAIAIIPGISRSGSTISTGMSCGLGKADTVKFSFLLALPVIFGASVLELQDFDKFTASFEPIPILLGFVSCYVTSIVALKVLIELVKASKLYYFSIYCFLIGSVTLIINLF